MAVSAEPDLASRCLGRNLFWLRLWRPRAFSSVSPERVARSALTMTSTSMPSCKNAPARGGRKPAHATSIATMLRPIPSRMPWVATRTVWRAIEQSLPHLLNIAAQQHDVGRLRRRGARLVGKDQPDVRLGQRRRVVDPVANHPDDSARALVGANQVELCWLACTRLRSQRQPQFAERALGRGAPIAGCHRQFNPMLENVPEHLTRVGLEAVLQNERRRAADASTSHTTRISP